MSRCSCPPSPCWPRCCCSSAAPPPRRRASRVPVPARPDFGRGRGGHARRADRPGPALRRGHPGLGRTDHAVPDPGRVTCGAIDGRATSPTGPGVALLLECDTPYYEDQAPAHSVGLVSPDGRTWSRTRLPGEAYRAPAISPRARYAAWLAGGTGQYVEWSAGTGFAKPARTSYRYDSGGETLVVDDTGTVTVIGPEHDRGLRLRGRRPHPRPGRREVRTRPSPVDPGCTEGAFENVDALTVLGGGNERATQFTLARARSVRRGRSPGRRRPTRRAWSGTAPPEADPTHYLYSTLPGVHDRGHRQPGPAPRPGPGLRRGHVDLGAADPGLQRRPALRRSTTRATSTSRELHAVRRRAAVRESATSCW